MNKVTVKINGVEYNLKGEEDEAYLHKIASYVDRRLKSLMERNERLTSASASVLTAINIVDEMFKHDSSLEDSDKKLEEFKNIEKKLKEEIKRLNYDNSNLKEKLKLKGENGKERELKFEVENLKKQVQNGRYKIIELQNKQLESQLNEVKKRDDF